MQIKKKFKSCKNFTLRIKIVTLKEISLIKFVKLTFPNKITKFHIPEQFQSDRNFFQSLIFGKRKALYINKIAWKVSIGRLHCFSSSITNTTKRYRPPSWKSCETIVVYESLYLDL